MPLFTVTMRSGRMAADKVAISAAIHAARVSAGYPDLEKPRSGDVLMIEALLSAGTDDARKRSLLAAIVTRLAAAGTDPNDVMVFFGEIDRLNSSFSGGRPALPVEVRP